MGAAHCGVRGVQTLWMMTLFGGIGDDWETSGPHWISPRTGTPPVPVLGAPGIGYGGTASATLATHTME